MVRPCAVAVVFAAASLSIVPSIAQDTQSGAAAAGAALQGNTGLPLQPGEVVIPFANGCGVVSNGQNSAAARTTMAAFNWIGACRFGLAHGEGFAQRTDGSSAFRERYQYGVLLGVVQTGASAPYRTKGNSGFFLGSIREDGRLDLVVVKAPESNAATLIAGYSIKLDVADGAGRKVDVFTFPIIKCPAQGPIDLNGTTIGSDDLVKVQASCRRKPATGMLGQMLGGSTGEFGLILHLHSTIAADGTKSPDQFSTRYCDRAFGMSECTKNLQDMIQPYAPRIQAIIDGQRRQYAEGLPWLTARFAPMEAAFSQKIRSIAARYAAASQAKGVRP